jgi:hypothetical protein
MVYQILNAKVGYSPMTTFMPSPPIDAAALYVAVFWHASSERAPHMDVGRLTFLITVEEESVRPYAQHSRHACQRS